MSHNEELKNRLIDQMINYYRDLDYYDYLDNYGLNNDGELYKQLSSELSNEDCIVKYLKVFTDEVMEYTNEKDSVSQEYFERAKKVLRLLNEYYVSYKNNEKDHEVSL